MSTSFDRSCDLDEWLKRISQVHPGSMALGLERVGHVYQLLGARPPAPVSIVVGGTNGKGSSVAMLSAIATRAGLKVGKSTSPHLFRFNERVQVNDIPLTDAELIAAFTAIDAARDDTPITYFEYATLAALWHFAEVGVDLAVLEVGLGGRLDAVNIIDADAALITSISRDHTRWLGDSLAGIAVEKAGVFKPGRIAVSADARAPEQLALEAASKGARFFAAGSDYQYEVTGSTWRWQCGAMSLDDLALPGLAGDHQLSNAAGCLMVLHQLGMLETLREHISPALAAIRLPGRLWQVASRPQVVLDVAHNEAGARALAGWLRKTAGPGRTIVVLGMLREKEPQAFVTPLAGLVDHCLLVTLPPPRGLSASQLAAELAPLALEITPQEALSDAMALALKRATKNDRIIVTGSFITVMLAADWLGVSDNPSGLARRSEFSSLAPPS